MIRASAIFAVLALAAPAAAETKAGDNGEAEAKPRDGFAIGVAAGPSILVGFQRTENQVTGVGGGVSLRLGTVATDKMMWFLETEIAAYEIVRDGDATLTRQQTTLTLGGHYYIRDTFWLGAGLGLAGFRAASTATSPDGTETLESEETRGGFATRWSGGIDLLRSGIFVLGVEAGLAIGVYSGEQLTNLTIRLGGSWY